MTRVAAALAAVVGVGAAGLAWAALPRPGTPHFADAQDRSMVVAGAHLYRARCSSCHGRALQGQPLWQLADAYAGRRAPAHDATGHTWRHPDEDLFQITKYGRLSGMSSASAMPAFAATRTDGDILAVLAFIKARWPLALQWSQAMLNPGRAGLPPDAAGVDWRFPPDCEGALRRTREASRTPRGVE